MPCVQRKISLVDNTPEPRPANRPSAADRIGNLAQYRRNPRNVHHISKFTFLDSVNLLKICNQTRLRSVEMRRVYRRHAELFSGTAAAGGPQIADLNAGNAGHC